MNRQEFLARFLPPREPATAGLEPYTPPLDEPRAYHLLRRTTFGVTLDAARRLTGLTADQAVELLLDNALQASPPAAPPWADEGFGNPERLPPAQRQAAYQAIYDAVYKQNYALKQCWLDAMRQDTLSLREKMTLFWHGHFTSKFAINGIMPAQAMYRQNALFRRLHQGSFRELALAVTLDGAMLTFLNGQESTRQAPNENYSRELLELFTTGLGQYTEKDVQEGARILTGWRTNFYKDEWPAFGVFNPFFWPDDHDTGEKNYLGVRFPPVSDNYDEAVRKNEVGRLIDTILTQRGPAVARFLAGKLYRFFVYGNPAASDQAVVQGLADALLAHDFQLRPVLALLLKSAHFFDPTNWGVQPKSPAEFVVGQLRHFNVAPDWASWVMDTMGQELFNPPDVAGWPGYRSWLTTRTFPFAVQQGGGFVWNQKDDALLAWVRQFPDYTDSRKLVRNIGKVLLARPLESFRLDRYQKMLLAGAPDYEWPNILNDAGSAASRLRVLLVNLVKAPDYHLG
jgi:uncharacterized protein (DUF1800 family)